MMILLFGREDVTRTRDPYVPNVVRYQLRHFSKKACKGTAFFLTVQIIFYFYIEKCVFGPFLCFVR